MRLAEVSAADPSNVGRTRTGTTLFAERYELRGLLGVGGMGSVYRAHDLELDEPVALKLLRRELLGQPGILDRFRREVKLARRVTHPCVARTFDIGVHGADRFLTMELVDGESLATLLDRERRLPVERALVVAGHVAAGVGAAHAAGVVHRDLKPDNVLIGRDGRVALTDFGIARAFVTNSAPLQTSGLMLGTPEYMAPEQLDPRAPIDGRADVYALGVMLYEMLVGDRPFRADSPFGVAAARLVAPPPDPRERIDLPPALAEIVLKCMARDPGSRFANIDALVRALADVVVPSRRGGTMARVALATTLPPPPWTPPRRVVAFLPLTTRAHDERTATWAEAIASLSADALSTSPGANVRAMFSAAPPPAATLGVAGALSIEGRTLRATIDVRHLADDVVVAHRTCEAASPFELAERIAAVVANSLDLPAPRRRAPEPSDADARQLYLRARVEALRDDPLAIDRAIALFERAITHAPNDSWINAGYATAMLRRFVDDERPIDDALEAAAMARRALDASPSISGAHAVLAAVAFELGDDTAAARALRAGNAVDVASADLAELEARMLSAAGDVEGALAAYARARALAPRRCTIALEEAATRAMSGHSLELSADDSAPPVATRLACRLSLWGDDPAAARAFLVRVARRHFVGKDVGVSILRAVAYREIDEAIHLARAAAERAAAIPRRAARHHAVVAELCARHDRVSAIAAIRAAVATGAIDLGWLDRAPPLAPLREDPTFKTLRAEAAVRAEATRRAMSLPAPTLDALSLSP